MSADSAGDIVLDGGYIKPEVEQAKRWLRGQEVPEPEPSALALTVNGYERAGPTWAEANEWLRERLPLLATADQAQHLSTQELLDALFLLHRKERFCEGTLSRLADEIDATMAVIRKRRRRGGAPSGSGRGTEVRDSEGLR